MSRLYVLRTIAEGVFNGQAELVRTAMHDFSINPIASARRQLDSQQAD